MNQLEEIRRLRFLLTRVKNNVSETPVSLNYDHWLMESIADWAIKTEGLISHCNEYIGELIE